MSTANILTTSSLPLAPDFTKIFELFWENEYLSYLITKEKLIQINYKNIKDILQLSLDHNHNYLFIDKKKIDKYRNILDNNI